jgi:hypothetical protein
MLDFDTTILVLDKMWAEESHILIYKRTELRIVKNYIGKREPEISLAYTYLLRLQYWKHFSIESFKLCPTDNDYNSILPFS